MPSSRLPAAGALTSADVQRAALMAHENLHGGILPHDFLPHDFLPHGLRSGGRLPQGFPPDPAQPGGLRREVRESWERSLRHREVPAPARPLLLWDDDEFKAYRRGHPMNAILPVIARLLVQPSHDTGLLVAIGDQRGRLLWVQGDRTARTKATRINFVEGADWSEAAVGTSAPGAALATDKSIQIAGAEHFNFGVRPWSCTAVPLHDPDSGAVLGIVDITGGSEAVARHTLSLVNATVAAAEAELRIQRLQRQTVEPRRRADRKPEHVRQGAAPESVRRSTALRTTPIRSTVPRGSPYRDSLRILGRDQCVLNLNGRPLPLSQRHAEILTVLALNPAGLPADELAPMIYPQGAPVTTLRAELVRLRRLLHTHGEGMVPASRPYRLPAELAVDAQLVLDYLGRGAHRLALSIYRGQVLPHSEAPAVVELRHRVSGLLREAVLGDAGVEVLLQYLQLPEAQADDDAWRTALRLLPARSPRRAAVVEHLERLQEPPS